MNRHIIRPETVTLIGKMLHPLTASNLITVPELNEIKAQLKYLAEHGTSIPEVVPKMIDQLPLPESLSIGLLLRCGCSIIDSTTTFGTPASAQ